SFLGLIDEVSVYNRALSATDVASIFTAGAAGKCPPVSEPQCFRPPSGLIGWWPGEGNAADAVDGNHGSLQNGATFATGKVGQAFTFDGANEYVSFGNTAGNFVTNDFSIEFGLNTTSTRLYSVLAKWPSSGN